jgi:hypothetical protein
MNRARAAIVVFNVDPELALHAPCRELADRHVALIESGFGRIRACGRYDELMRDVDEFRRMATAGETRSAG